MIDRLEILRHTIEFHHTIRDNILHVNQSVNDLVTKTLCL